MATNRQKRTDNIFISYRREDSTAYAGRLCDHLNATFGPKRIFIDIEDIAPGQQFAKVIEKTMAECSVALVVIGPRWSDILHQRLSEQGHDYVVFEIQAALARGIPIVPVLVGGASIAQLKGLPDNIAQLQSYHAAELRDSSFKEDCNRLAQSLKLEPVAKSRRKLILMGAAAAALVALVLALGIGPYTKYRARKSATSTLLATARTQAERTEFEAAFRTCQKLLQVDASDRTALELQVDMAMRWLQNFSVVAGEGTRAEDIAAPLLAEIIGVLDPALARTDKTSVRASDILAHLGWAHWLNQRLALKEFGSAAERDLRQSLTIDPSNVFGNAMLGNWMIQNGRDKPAALEHFRRALDTRKERPFVRRLQLGAMIYTRDPVVLAELIRNANDMRKNSEQIGERDKRRILTAYNPTVNEPDELNLVLSAVPPEDAWATYLWLDAPDATGAESEEQRIRRNFIQASIMELEGRRTEALHAFEALASETKSRGYVGRFPVHINSAIERLSQGSAPAPARAQR